MSDIGYGQPAPGIYGVPDAGDPVTRAALQEAVIAANQKLTTRPGYVPPNYAGRPGTGALPVIGWTCQKDTGPAVQLLSPDHMGHTPDWTSDANSIAAGRYDQNEVLTGLPVNPLNRAPIGDGLLQYDDTPTNPNAPKYDVGGTAGELEY